MGHSRILGIAVVGLAVSLSFAAPASAGKIFITGHDPDFHAQDSTHAQTLLRTGLDFVTSGTFDDAAPAKKFLWVESRIAPPGGFRTGELGLTAIGLALGTQYDRANAAELAAVDFSLYSAIAVASSFGGMLTSAEINALIARKADITSFVNAGGGLLALAECFPDSSFCIDDNVDSSTKLFGFLPLAASSVATTSPYTVTAFGASLGLTNDDVNDPTHNSFGPVAGLGVVDNDAAGVPTTLAGDVRISDGGFEPIPGLAPLALLGLGGGLLALRRRGRAR